MIYLQVLLNGLLLGGFYLLMALGFSVIFGVMKIVNFAHGAFIVLSGLASFSMTTKLGINPLLSLPVVVIMSAGVGVLVQWLVIERIKSGDRDRELLTLMATFGISYIMVNIGQEVWGSQFRAVTFLQSSVSVGALRFPEAMLVGFGLALVIVAALGWWFTHASAGLALRATSQSSVGAESCGINSRRIRLLGFALGSGIAGASGVLVVMSQPIAPQFSNSFTIIAFVVVALGGLGNNLGAALGAVLVGVTQTFAGFELGTVAQNAVPYVLLILIMLLRPQGLLPQKVR